MLLLLLLILLYKVDREKLVKHHSGQYRHKTAFIWDPHPQYKFTAFGHLFHLVLIQDSKFVSPDIKVSDRFKYLKINNDVNIITLQCCFHTWNTIM